MGSEEVKVRNKRNSPRLDRRHAKKVCVWLRDHCLDVANVAELISLRANRLYATKIKISNMTDLEKVSKVVESLKLLIFLSMRNLEVANSRLTQSFDRLANKHSQSSSRKSVQSDDTCDGNNMRAADTTVKDMDVGVCSEFVRHSESDGRNSFQTQDFAGSNSKENLRLSEGSSKECSRRCSDVEEYGVSRKISLSDDVTVSLSGKESPEATILEERTKQNSEISECDLPLSEWEKDFDCEHILQESNKNTDAQINKGDDEMAINQSVLNAVNQEEKFDSVDILEAINKERPEISSQATKKKETQEHKRTISEVNSFESNPSSKTVTEKDGTQKSFIEELESMFYSYSSDDDEEEMGCEPHSVPSLANDQKKNYGDTVPSTPDLRLGKSEMSDVGENSRPQSEKMHGGRGNAECSEELKLEHTEESLAAKEDLLKDSGDECSLRRGRSYSCLDETVSEGDAPNQSRDLGTSSLDSEAAMEELLKDSGDECSVRRRRRVRLYSSSDETLPVGDAPSRSPDLGTSRLDSEDISHNHNVSESKVSLPENKEEYGDGKLLGTCVVKLEPLSPNTLEEHIFSKPASEESDCPKSEETDEKQLTRLLNLETLKRKQKRWSVSNSDASTEENYSLHPSKGGRKVVSRDDKEEQKSDDSEIFSSCEEGSTIPVSQDSVRYNALRRAFEKPLRELEEEFEDKRNRIAKAALENSSSETEFEPGGNEEDKKCASPTDVKEAASASLLEEEKEDVNPADENEAASTKSLEGDKECLNPTDKNEAVSTCLLEKEKKDGTSTEEPSPSLLEDMTASCAEEIAKINLMEENKEVKNGEEEGVEGECSSTEKKKSNWRNNNLLRGKLSESPPREREIKENTKNNGEPSVKRRILGVDSDDNIVVLDSSEESDSFGKTSRQKRMHSSTSSSDNRDIISRPKKNARKDVDSSVINLDSTDDEEVFLPVRPMYRKNRSSSTTSSSNFKNENGIVKKHSGGYTMKDWLISSSSIQAKKGQSHPKNPPAKGSTTSSDSEDGDMPNTQSTGDTPNKGRRNIRALMKDDSIAETTQVAVREEEERRRRIAEKQKMYNDLCIDLEKNVTRVDRLVLDIDPKTKEPLVQVDKKIARKLKPHQVKGVKFMWDACFESVDRAREGKGSGCILAHCMGLGKTFQVVALVHTLINHQETKVKTVMIVCPFSTVLNWANEFNMWLRETDQVWKVKVYELSRCRQNSDRAHLLRSWHEGGGVMIIGYEMFRNLSNLVNERVFQRTLLNPGPDLVVCDEGHLLKNEKTALSKAMCKIRTRRRIVLTGTPLQNNLKEYHCMMQFVKPNLLGTLKEFRNRFVNPINNGQFEDSTPQDVKVMKRRAHVLHKMLEGCVQRFDYSVLRPLLPPKQEYVISIRLTDLQIKLYWLYLKVRTGGQNFAGTQGAQLFTDFQALQKVWTHPLTLKMAAERNKKMGVEKGPINDFVQKGHSSEKENVSFDSDDSDIMIVDADGSEKPVKLAHQEQGVVQVKQEAGETSVNQEWWANLLKGGEMEDMRESGKLVLLFSILRDCEAFGDKLLVFSQSLYSLDLIEYFLKRINKATHNDVLDETLNNHKGTWVFGKDYFRLDGSTSAENRSAWCKAFNQEDNRSRLFLVSTRAGGLGINLYGANRAIIFDASWNPSHDVQSIFRVYRFGQKKPCFIYRFLASGTMEEKIYDRQVAKLSLSCRVVDEQQIERHYNMADLAELYRFNPEQKTKRPTPILPKDVLLAELLKENDSFIETYHEHDSLLENKEEEELNEEERKAAWEDYENEKRGLMNAMPEGEGEPLRNTFTTARDFYDIVRKQFPYLADHHIQEKAEFLLRRMNHLRSNNTISAVPNPRGPPHLQRNLPPPTHQLPRQVQRPPPAHQQQRQVQQEEALMARHSMATLSGSTAWASKNPVRHIGPRPPYPGQAPRPPYPGQAPRPTYPGPRSQYRWTSPTVYPSSSTMGPRSNVHPRQFRPRTYSPGPQMRPPNRFSTVPTHQVEQRLQSLLKNNRGPNPPNFGTEP
ncbi:transcriptional regulator ATRX homolog isoform X2 [Anabrus simplex]|uniref:transcriptional regulator ATRX homolog isoform X2 n=1 Tax=Anabrus simplex TaxID=316456 RepID=UPI0035A2B27A